jgi:prolipoprotein diacylglyceryltransferase
MAIHLFFDLLSYLVAGVVSFKYFKAKQNFENKDIKLYYYGVLVIGFVTGAVLFSTINNYLTLGHLILGKSIIGAIFGAIAAIEIFKKIFDIKGSTGAYFVPSLAIGIAIGRLGCFFAGLEDFTYGVETNLPWGVDFGDGKMRHPVQLYESVSMFLFFLYSIWLYKKDKKRFERVAFYDFVAFYAIQRFFWESLKPYKTVALGLNIFQIICILLLIYAIIYRRKNGILQ